MHYDIAAMAERLEHCKCTQPELLKWICTEKINIRHGLPFKPHFGAPETAYIASGLCTDFIVGRRCAIWFAPNLSCIRRCCALNSGPMTGLPNWYCANGPDELSGISAKKTGFAGWLYVRISIESKLAVPDKIGFSVCLSAGLTD